MSGTPNFAQTPHTESAVATATTGNLTSDSPTNTVPIFTATVATNITRITAQPRGTTTTGTAAYLFISKSAVPAVIRQKDSVTVPAQTVSATAAVNKSTFTDITEQTPLRLGAGDILSCGLGSAQAVGIVFNVETADF